MSNKTPKSNEANILESQFMQERIKLLDFQVHQAINAAKVEALEQAIAHMQSEITKLRNAKWGGK